MCTRRLAPIAPILFLAACAHAPMTYRLTQQSGRPLLIPPGDAHPEAPSRTVTASITPGTPNCPAAADAVALKPHGSKLRLTISREALAKKPADWLAAWAGEAEDRGCIAPGQARKLASDVADSVALDPAVSFRLLHANNVQAGYIDLGPEDRLEVVAPILESRQAATDAPLVETQNVSGSGNSINLDLKLSPAVRGVETTEYAVNRKPGGGFTLAPAAVQRRFSGGTGQPDAPLDKPLIDYLKFPPTAAFFRLIYKAEDNDVKAVVLGAATHAQLELANCGKTASCVTLPKAVGINPVMSVTVNGKPVTLGVGMRVWNAVLSQNVHNPSDVLKTLKVSKPYDGRLVPIDFDRATRSILDLQLNGGESIEWQPPAK